MQVKNQKIKKMCHKKKFKFEDYKNCLETTQLENKIIHINNNKTDVKSLIEHHKNFLRNKKIILKSQQKLKSKRYNVFTEEINKITLSSNDDK